MAVGVEGEVGHWCVLRWIYKGDEEIVVFVFSEEMFVFVSRKSNSKGVCCRSWRISRPLHSFLCST